MKTITTIIYYSPTIISIFRSTSAWVVSRSSSGQDRHFLFSRLVPLFWRPFVLTTLCFDVPLFWCHFDVCLFGCLFILMSLCFDVPLFCSVFVWMLIFLQYNWYHLNRFLMRHIFYHISIGYMFWKDLSCHVWIDKICCLK